MEQRAIEHESNPTDHDVVVAEVGDDADTSVEVLDELLIEEISIDGMCGVY